MKNRLAILLCAGTALCAAPHIASATAITATSDILITWSLPSPGGGVQPKATAEMANFNFVGNTVTFDMRVTNTSTGTTAGNTSRFTSFGWDTAPASTAVTDTTAVYASVVNDALGPDSLSVCLYSGSNCNGGSNGGLVDPLNNGFQGNPSTTGIFSMTVTFAQHVPPLDFSNFDGKFQTFAGSVEGFGTVTNCATGCIINPTLVDAPEPASMALLGVGLLGLGFLRHRKQG